MVFIRTCYTTHKLSLTQVILFLVVCPFLVVFFFCWFVVKCFYNYLRDLNLKEAVAAVYAQSQQVSGVSGRREKKEEEERDLGANMTGGKFYTCDAQVANKLGWEPYSRAPAQQQHNAFLLSQKSLSSTSNPPTVYPCGDQQQNWDQVIKRFRYVSYTSVRLTKFFSPMYSLCQSGLAATRLSRRCGTRAICKRWTRDTAADLGRRLPPRAEEVS